MYEQIEKPKENTSSADRRKSRAVANSVAQKRSDGKQGFGFVDNRLEVKKGHIIQAMKDRNETQKQQPIQGIMKKAGMDETAYKKLTMSTVILYAELDGKPVGTKGGIFTTGGGNHAEANLKAFLESSGLTKGNLVIWLSTSPCSSSFGTRDDGHEGCQEKLESLHSTGFNVTVHSDHPYQPHAVAAMEREQGFPGGFSSVSSAHASSFPSTFSHAPKALTHGDLADTGEPVAQLKDKEKTHRH